jgi:SAM-dependent methyltransferase
MTEGIDNRDFWESQARQHGEDVEAVNFDVLSDDFPVLVFDELIADGTSVADVGCGNGRNLIDLARSRPNGHFVGYDFAETFIEVAEQRRMRLGLNNVRFELFDATDNAPPARARAAFDIVIGKRLLINVHGPAKLRALRNVHAMLREDGVYIMSECFMEPLNRINEMRMAVGVDPITVRPFNEYLTLGFMPEVEALFSVEKVIDVDSLYYFISRVFNARLSDGDPDYNAPMNRLAAQLVLLGFRPMAGYTPEYIHILRRLPNVAGF